VTLPLVSPATPWKALQKAVRPYLLEDENRRMALWAGFELATLRSAAGSGENLSALSGVAYGKSGAIFPSLAALNVAPKMQAMLSQSSARIAEEDSGRA
jgi:hypothetical protein